MRRGQQPIELTLRERRLAWSLDTAVRSLSASLGRALDAMGDEPLAADLNMIREVIDEIGSHNTVLEDVGMTPQDCSGLNDRVRALLDAPAGMRA